MPLADLAAPGRRTDLSGRYSRSGPRSAGRDTRRGSDAGQRSDEHRAHDCDERRRRIRLCERAAGQLLVLDFVLQVGEFSEQITVSGEAPAIDRVSPAVSTSLTKEYLEALPIFGRNTFFASVASANVIASGDPQFVRMQDQSGASSL